MQTLKAEDPRLRFEAAAGLACLGEKAGDAFPALLEARKDPDGRVRELVNLSLGIISQDREEAVPFLLESLTDSKAEVRNVIAQTLGRTGLGTFSMPLPPSRTRCSRRLTTTFGRSGEPSRTLFVGRIFKPSSATEGQSILRKETEGQALLRTETDGQAALRTEGREPSGLYRT
jgi:hypothetical protein